ncbi:MAG: glutamine-hydrolyzing GMP synthase [Candidatus Cloacimonetes bacterium]|nr:glutamine-hydrolyzing GMP synthase [Candidatus Cloacimonadota bacterium]MBL7086272.1 glutamine-hydrolyzing GMP synthase [Candidatus Cloacimonadota bacterium]
MKNFVLILDFGSQFTHLIAKSVRFLKIKCEVVPYNISLQEVKKKSPAGIIFSGSPKSVLDKKAPICDKKVFDLGIPILGICYGMQLITYLLGGKVINGSKKEYGYVETEIIKDTELLSGLNSKDVIWMSHSDIVEKIPKGFESFAHTMSSPFVSMQNIDAKIYAVQFHPEVTHTEKGLKVFENFLFKICKIKSDWSTSWQTFIEKSIKSLKDKAGNKRVLLGLSGGVDSSVTAVLLHKAIGDRLIPIFVDTGLMRKNEVTEIIEAFEGYLKIKLYVVYAAEKFFHKLRGVIDPEEKRKIIGNLFIEIFEQEAQKFDDVEFLAQGTLYPDVIESSVSTKTSVTIKSHHNVGGLPEKMNLKVIEPLRELLKYEVRKIGKELKIPEKILNRHPFPGPGLAVRIIGEVTPEKVKLLQEIDAIFIDELIENNYYDKIWQAFAVLLPIQSVGVMGDNRTYENVCALRAVNSLDGMTADWSRIPYKILQKVSNRIINEVSGINRVVYDISSKPPSTIEWE